MCMQAPCWIQELVVLMSDLYDAKTASYWTLGHASCDCGPHYQTGDEIRMHINHAASKAHCQDNLSYSTNLTASQGACLVEAGDVCISRKLHLPWV